ncbi:MAG: hypothetical protein HQL32_05720 [Planctomycetes bacterium]|nr:hypothetical protein [Planctomycetota bacterium]
MLKSSFYPQGNLSNNLSYMPDYFRNLEETLNNIDPEDATLSSKIRVWMNDHLRVVWTLVMMFVLSLICVWVSVTAGRSNPEGSIIENIDPRVSPENMQNNLEKGVKQGLK